MLNVKRMLKIAGILTIGIAGMYIPIECSVREIVEKTARDAFRDGYHERENLYRLERELKQKHNGDVDNQDKNEKVLPASYT